MQYMYLVFLKGDCNDIYGNNTTCIDFIIQDIFIKATIEGIHFSIHATFLLSRKLIISYATLLTSYSDIITFQEWEWVGIHPYAIF